MYPIIQNNPAFFETESYITGPQGLTGASVALQDECAALSNPNICQTYPDVIEDEGGITGGLADILRAEYSLFDPRASCYRVLGEMAYDLHYLSCDIVYRATDDAIIGDLARFDKDLCKLPATLSAGVHALSCQTSALIADLGHCGPGFNPVQFAGDLQTENTLIDAGLGQLNSFILSHAK